MINVDFVPGRPLQDFFVSFDVGGGFSPQHKYFIPYKSHTASKRVCFLPRKIQSIRFEGCEGCEGSIEKYISGFEINFLWPGFAVDRLLSRIINWHFCYRNYDKKKLIVSLRGAARKEGLSWRDYIFKRYDETFLKTTSTQDYKKWFGENETNRDISLSYFLSSQVPLNQRHAIGPKIALILPVYNTNETYLAECIDSVLNQSYANWQLCIVNDASTDKNLDSLLAKYAGEDERIDYQLRAVNGGIARASNDAMAMADADYIGFIDHDDALAIDTLAHCALAIKQNPRLGLLYTDEDKIDADSHRFEPHFKPDFNLDLLLSQNYICHFTLYKAELIQSLGGLREGLDGSQDHDLLLRAALQLEDDQIHHISRVLYHWRAVEGSTALSADQKSYSTQAGIAALNHYHQLKGNLTAVDSGLLPNTYKHTWPIPQDTPLVSLLIPTRDNYLLLKNCIESILEKTSYTNYEILILDNGSICSEVKSYLSVIEAEKRVKVCEYNKPFNYSEINNYGSKLAKGEILALLNDDIEVINNEWLSEMVSHVVRSEIGCVGAKLYYPNETIQHAGVVLGIGGVAGHGHKYLSRNAHGYFARLRLVHNVSAVTGACLLIRKGVFESVGGLNEQDLAVAFNDVDLCLKVRDAGYRNLWTPYAELYHHESASRGLDRSMQQRNRAEREAAYMRRRWGDLLDNDPAYNCNLTLIHEDFSLK